MHLVPRNICCCNLIPLLGISSLSLTFNLVSVGVTFQGISQGNPVCWKISSQPTKQGSHCICHLNKLLSGQICNLKVNENPFSRILNISLQKIFKIRIKNCENQRTREPESSLKFYLFWHFCPLWIKLTAQPGTYIQETKNSEA